MSTPMEPGGEQPTSGTGSHSQPAGGQPSGDPAQPGYGQPGYGGSTFDQPPPPPPPPTYEAPGYGGPGYGGPGYGTPAYGAPAGGGWSGPPLAVWGERVVAGLIDYFAPFIVAGLLINVNRALGSLAYLLALGWVIYNKVLEGNTGQSYGKKIAGTRLLREQDGQVVGVGLAIGRWLLHILDGLPCYLGYLWPIWDAKRQTFADKIVHTVVIKV